MGLNAGAPDSVRPPEFVEEAFADRCRNLDLG